LKWDVELETIECSADFKQNGFKTWG